MTDSSSPYMFAASSEYPLPKQSSSQNSSNSNLNAPATTHSSSTFLRPASSYSSLNSWGPGSNNSKTNDHNMTNNSNANDQTNTASNNKGKNNNSKSNSSQQSNASAASNNQNNVRRVQSRHFDAFNSNSSSSSQGQDLMPTNAGYTYFDDNGWPSTKMNLNSSTSPSLLASKPATSRASPSHPGGGSYTTSGPWIGTGSEATATGGSTSSGNNGPTSSTNSVTNMRHASGGSSSISSMLDGTKRAASVAGSASSANSTPAASSQQNQVPLSSDEELIPTAIVIKNIPFAIKKEQLLDVMTTLGLPLPYAFNYHFDNGVFRGLAFANFTTPEETSSVINNLNGREIGGRKLRVEYKKMLPLAERERIEREKRERRGQLEEQHRGPQQQKGMVPSPNQGPGSVSGGSSSGAPGPGQTSGPGAQHANNVNHNAQGPNSASMLPPPQGHHHPGGPQFQHQVPGAGAGGSQPHGHPSHPHHGPPAPPPPPPSAPGFPTQASPNSVHASPRVDLNDPETLEFYSQMLLFRDDRGRNELLFPPTLTNHQRRIVMLLCSQLGLACGQDKTGGVLITRYPSHLPPPVIPQQQQQPPPHSLPPSQQPHPPHQQQHGLFDYMHHPQPQHPQNAHGSIFQPPLAPHAHPSMQQQQSQQGPVAPQQNQLRGTKSFADIRGNGMQYPYNISAPGTPTGSPFFPAHTPPPQLPHQGVVPLSLSLQQQRGQNPSITTAQHLHPHSNNPQQLQHSQSTPFDNQMAAFTESFNSVMSFGGGGGHSLTRSSGAASTGSNNSNQQPIQPSSSSPSGSEAGVIGSKGLASGENAKHDDDL